MHKFETPYQREVKRAGRAALGWPAYEIIVNLSEPEREFLASLSGLIGLDRDDERLLGQALKNLLTKLMAQAEELQKERQAPKGG